MTNTGNEGPATTTTKTTPLANAAAAAVPHYQAVLISWGMALALLLIPVRAHVMGYAWYWLSAPLQQGWPVLAGAYLDLLYVTGITVLFLLLLRVNRRVFFRRLVCGTFMVVSVVSLLWAMANIEVVKMLGQPLNYPWLYYSGFLRGFDAQEAIAASLSWNVAAAITGIIAGMAIMAFLLGRALRLVPTTGRLWRWLLIGAVVAGGIYLPLAAGSMRSFYPPCLQNPVVAFAQSLMAADRAALFTLATNVAADDFQISSERGHSPRSTFVPPQPPVKNVLVIVLESVAAQYLPAYGGKYPVTPELDRYMGQSRMFGNISAHAPNTNKELVSLLCSTYPSPTYRFETEQHPKAGFISLSDVLKAQGYRTGVFYAADLRFGNAEGFLVNHQFDVLKDYRSLGDGKPTLVSNEKDGFLDAADDATLGNSLLSWVNSDKNRPFFAIMWTGQTHYPYFALQKQTAFDGVSDMQNRYLNALRETDAAIGQVLRSLQDSGQLASTLVVVVGDHGEAFGQHHQYGHANRLYSENIHIPLLLLNPRLFKGEHDPAVGGMVDIAPTILDVLGLSMPGNWQGQSLFSTQRSGRTYFLAPWSGATFGYRDADRKYLFEAVSGKYEVYDLKQDPAELHNLASTLTPAELDLIQQRLAAWVQYQDRLIKKLASQGNAVSAKR